MATAVELHAVDMVREAVERFAEAVRHRSESDPIQRRRSKRRYQRSWPLAVRYNGAQMSAALHNASDEGIAFLSPGPILPGTVVFVKLFCYDDSATYVPAIVRHSTNTEHGHLVGCEFAVWNEPLCLKALRQSDLVARAD